MARGHAFGLCGCGAPALDHEVSQDAREPVEGDKTTQEPSLVEDHDHYRWMTAWEIASCERQPKL